MYRFEILLVLNDGQSVDGKAFQTGIDENKNEYIVLETKSGTKQIVLDKITSMEAITKNPHFTKIIF